MNNWRKSKGKVNWKNLFGRSYLYKFPVGYFPPTFQPGPNTSLQKFKIGSGGWILLAKAQITALSPNRADGQFIFKATEAGVVEEDRSSATLYDLKDYATLSLMLYIEVTDSAEVELLYSMTGNDKSETGITNLVITGINKA